MPDVFGLSDVSSPDTGRGKSTSLKTGGMRRKYNMKKSPKLGKGFNKKNKDRCKKWKELGFASEAGCRHDSLPKKSKFKKITKKAVQRGMQL
tara:strand:- start:60 stop:335 length:276 start_codon:yes stop_codon:yes gene_type:complete